MTERAMQPPTWMAGTGRAEAGSSLLEVLVSLVIIAIGVLGLVGLQTTATGHQKDSFDRMAAAELLSQIGERMRANHLGFMANAYASSLLPGAAMPEPVPCVIGAPCTPAAVAAMDLAHWYGGLRERLPDSGAVVASAAGGIGAGAASMRVTMIWRELRNATAALPECIAVGITDASYRCLTAEVFP